MVSLLQKFQKWCLTHFAMTLHIFTIIIWLYITQISSAHHLTLVHASCFINNNKFNNSLDTVAQNSNILHHDFVRKTMVTCFAAGCDHTSESHHCCYFNFPKEKNAEFKTCISMCRSYDHLFVWLTLLQCKYGVRKAWTTCYCTTPSKLVVHKPVEAENAAHRPITNLPLHSSDVTISVCRILCGFAQSYHVLKSFCEWDMCYALMHAGYI